MPSPRYKRLDEQSEWSMIDEEWSFDIHIPIIFQSIPDEVLNDKLFKHRKQLIDALYFDIALIITKLRFLAGTNKWYDAYQEIDYDMLRLVEIVRHYDRDKARLWAQWFLSNVVVVDDCDVI